MTVRIGVIGTGVMGADHARLLQQSVSGAVVTAVCDLDSDRSNALAIELATEALPQPIDVITASNVDAVLIASHDRAHAEQVAQCLDAGKPVLCEKPLATSVEECEQIVRAERGRNLVTVGFMRRCHNGFRALKEQLNSGDLGQPLMIRSSQRTVSSYPDGGSEATILNTAVHDIDLAAWMLESPIVEVSWHAPRSTSLDVSRQDPQVMLLRTASNVLVVVDIFLNARYGFDTKYEIVCETGAAHITPFSDIQIDHARRSSFEYSPDWRKFYGQAYRTELQAWIDHLRGRSTTSDLATAKDALVCTQVANALVESMRTAASVRVDVDTAGSVPIVR